jgi:hypothetical protein
MHSSFTWSTANTSSLASPACISPSGPYLSIGPKCLIGSGGVYLFTVQVSDALLGVSIQRVSECTDKDETGEAVGRHDERNPLLTCSQVAVRVNTAPTGGNCSVTPHKGMALVTEFHLACTHWMDVEGHLPLAYRFTAYRNRYVQRQRHTRTSALDNVPSQVEFSTTCDCVRQHRLVGSSQVALSAWQNASSLQVGLMLMPRSHVGLLCALLHEG